MSEFKVGDIVKAKGYNGKGREVTINVKIVEITKPDVYGRDCVTETRNGSPVRCLDTLSTLFR